MNDSLIIRKWLKGAGRILMFMCPKCHQREHYQTQCNSCNTPYEWVEVTLAETSVKQAEDDKMKRNGIITRMDTCPECQSQNVEDRSVDFYPNLGLLNSNHVCNHCGIRFYRKYKLTPLEVISEDSNWNYSPEVKPEGNEEGEEDVNAE